MNLPIREQSGDLIVSVSGRIDHTRREEFTVTDRVPRPTGTNGNQP